MLSGTIYRCFARVLIQVVFRQNHTNLVGSVPFLVSSGWVGNNIIASNLSMYFEMYLGVASLNFGPWGVACRCIMKRFLFSVISFWSAKIKLIYFSPTWNRFASWIPKFEMHFSGHFRHNRKTLIYEAREIYTKAPNKHRLSVINSTPQSLASTAFVNTSENNALLF